MWYLGLFINYITQEGQAVWDLLRLYGNPKQIPIQITFSNLWTAPFAIELYPSKLLKILLRNLIATETELTFSKEKTLIEI